MTSLAAIVRKSTGIGVGMFQLGVLALRVSKSVIPCLQH